MNAIANRMRSARSRYWDASCRIPCGIARLTDRAERAWRAELATTSLADLVEAAGVGAAKRLAGWLESPKQSEAR